MEQILSLRADLMEAAEKLRRSETDKQQLETDIASLKQQVRTRLLQDCQAASDSRARRMLK